MADVDVDNSVKDYDFLKLVDSNFADLVGYYLGLWQDYHTLLVNSAGVIIGGLGLAWTSILMMRSPEDKLRSVFTGLTGTCLMFLLLNSTHKCNAHPCMHFVRRLPAQALA
ncbi:hypothetical protein LU659_21845, partial [Pseudomonas monteilii]|uniref:hypothetical protein n=1 Tax=Pseudomonas monteilii TaxID=76759 RepID=UPI001E45189B